MVYNTQNHCFFWGGGFCPSSGILETRKHNVSETGSVSVLRLGGEDTYSVGSRPNPHSLRTETDAVSEKLCFLVSRIPDDGQNPKTQRFWVDNLSLWCPQWGGLIRLPRSSMFLSEFSVDPYRYSSVVHLLALHKARRWNELFCKNLSHDVRYMPASLWGV
jgi:hypothetical protein